MSATDLLIDGYNLLHAAGYGRVHYLHGDLQRARQRLLKKLFQLLTPAEIFQTAVVFDAKEPPPGLPSNWYIHGLRVMYAQPHGDADEMLEHLIQEHSAPRRLTVVSSDHRLHRAAKSRRATVIDSDEFLEHLERRHPNLETAEIPDPLPTSPKATGEATTAELSYWMRFFGDVKISDLLDTNLLAKTIGPKHSRPDITTKSIRETLISGSTKGDSLSVEDSSKTRSSKRRHLSQPTHQIEENHSPKEPTRHPELFSQEWIDELQKWVDGMQGR